MRCSHFVRSSAFAVFLGFLSVLVVSTEVHGQDSFFIRGDGNGDTKVDISDGVFILNFLFQGTADPSCMDAIDANDSGTVDLSDSVFSFNYLFLGGPPISAPFPECGGDPSADALDCFEYEACDVPLDPAEQMQRARNAEDGPVDIVVPGSVVTFVRPSIGNDAAGFYAQVGNTGPAIFVVLPEAGAGGGGPVAVGDRIDFRATEIGTSGGARTVVTYADLVVVETGVDVGALEQEVSDAADLVDNLDQYESELVAMDCTLVGAFGFAGSGFSSSQVDTPGITGESNLKLRMPSNLRDVLALEHNFVEGCELQIVGPMGRFFAQAQPSVYSQADLTVVSCPDPPADPSAQIAAARCAGDGAASLAIDGAIVTYRRPAVGSAPAGFFVQADQEGPALAVDVDWTTMDPMPMVGDTVSFTITEMGTIFDARNARAIENLTIDDTGFDVTTLIQDVSLAEDLVSNLDNYESELLNVVVTIDGNFGGAGSGHVSAVVETDGVAGDSDLRLRIPQALHDALATVHNFGPGCVLDVTGPMWRFRDQAQPSAYAEIDIVVDSCPAPPAPQVTGAAATSETTVELTFDLEIDPASVTAPGTQFTFVPAIVALDAAVDGTAITLTTEEQTPSTDYTVTVSDTVTSLLGAGVDPAANSAMFTSLASGLSISSTDFAVIAHGAGFVINGNGFEDVTSVLLGGELQSFSVDSPTQITVTDVPDLTPTGDRDLVVMTTGGATDPFTVTVVHLVINEVDADQAGTDAGEFVEIGAGVAGVDLSGYAIVLYNGSDDRSYQAIDLNGVTNGDGLFIVGPAGFAPAPQATWPGPTNQLQNGADAVALVQGAAADFPNDSAIPPAGLIDAVVHGTNDGDDAGLIDPLLGVGGVQRDEGENGDKDGESIQRCAPARLDGSAFFVAPPTAGAVNTCP